MKFSYLTITTDASWDPTCLAAGYAFQAVCNDFRIKKSGPLKALPKSSDEAEIMAIGNALAALSKVQLPKVDYLIINTDSRNAMNAIRHQTTDLGKQVSLLWFQVADKCYCRVREFRHVKAHSGTGQPRKWVNDWCDREAKIQMRKQRLQFEVNSFIFVKTISNVQKRKTE